jgi:hypothetical protein
MTIRQHDAFAFVASSRVLGQWRPLPQRAVKAVPMGEQDRLDLGYVRQFMVPNRSYRGVPEATLVKLVKMWRERAQAPG